MTQIRRPRRSRCRLAAVAALMAAVVGDAWALPAATTPAASSAASAADADAVHQAQVEARILSTPRLFRGSDGLSHLAYELRITSFQPEDDPLELVRVAVFQDGAAAPLRTFDGAEVAALRNRAAAPDDPKDGLPIASGRSATLFLWLSLPPGVQPRSLRHQLAFRTAQGRIERADNVRTAVVAPAPLVIGPPLRGGRWLAVEGPGNPLSHHWGSPVAIDGRLTIPQRFAIDWFGLDDSGHSLHGRHDTLAASVDEDWVGYGKDVLAVADGVVVDARDGVVSQGVLSPQEEPADLTARTLYGNFIVLRIASGVYAHYAHLSTGSVNVRPGARVRRGDVIGRLGQTGLAGAPHLHFQVSDLPTFEQSDGLPYAIDRFTRDGRTSLEETFDPDKPVELQARPGGGMPAARRNELPLDGDVVTFP